MPEKLAEIKRKYDELCTAAEDRKKKLEETVEYHVLIAEVDFFISLFSVIAKIHIISTRILKAKASHSSSGSLKK